MDALGQVCFRTNLNPLHPKMLCAKLNWILLMLNHIKFFKLSLRKSYMLICKQKIIMLNSLLGFKKSKILKVLKNLSLISLSTIYFNASFFFYKNIFPFIIRLVKHSAQILNNIHITSKWTFNIYWLMFMPFFYFLLLTEYLLAFYCVCNGTFFHYRLP